jgi:hypothetical protein
MNFTIELGRGATYANNRFTVYKYSIYDESSVLAGQTRRQWIDDFDTLEEARAAYPEAEVQVSHSLYRPPYLGHLPQED